MIRAMSQQFAEQLSKEKQLNFQLQRELQEKDAQLKLLPDFQKEAEERRKEAEAKEIEEAQESPKRMTFWLKELNEQRDISDD